MKKAILVVDMQKDFLMPGAPLEVPGGREIIPTINAVIRYAHECGWLIIMSRDWHPKQTLHFEKWPEHCVENTDGATFHEDLVRYGNEIIISKGVSLADDGYSPFEGCDALGKSLHEVLQEHRVKTLYVCGVATDYCVKEAVIDACKRNYNVIVLQDAIKAVNRNPLDESEAMYQMRAEGAHTMTASFCKEKEVADEEK